MRPFACLIDLVDWWRFAPVAGPFGFVLDSGGRTEGNLSGQRTPILHPRRIASGPLIRERDAAKQIAIALEAEAAC